MENEVHTDSQPDADKGDDKKGGASKGAPAGDGAASTGPQATGPSAALAEADTLTTPSLEEIAEQTQESLLAEVMAASGLLSSDPACALVEEGVKALLGFIVRTGGDGDPVDIAGVDLLIAELTDKMSRQIDEILHHPLFQKLESSWRLLKFVVDRVDFRENTRVEFFNASKRDLLEDFEDSPEIPKCGLYRLVYSAEYGQFGGRPYGLLVANYEFSPAPQDMALLDNCAAVATMSHAPFIAAASSQFFGLDDFLTLPQLNELQALFEGPQYTKWRAYRDSEDARYVGLCLPRFLLRLPYGARMNRVRAFAYEENVSGHHERYLWGNAAFAFATRVAESFARYRWCPNIVGPSTGGTVEDLPLHEYEALGRIQTKIPTEIMITERREFEIAREGFIPFTYRPDTADACFFSANSTQRPKTFGISKDGRDAELNFRLGTQLPYLFITCRLAHYIKVIQRENIGTWKERHDLERELQKWIMQYVADQEAVSPSVRARRPLRKAKVTIAEVAGNAGWYKVDLQVQPHFRYMGAVFRLGLVGRMEQE